MARKPWKKSAMAAIYTSDNTFSGSATTGGITWTLTTSSSSTTGTGSFENYHYCVSCKKLVPEFHYCGPIPMKQLELFDE